MIQLSDKLAFRCTEKSLSNGLEAEYARDRQQRRPTVVTQALLFINMQLWDKIFAGPEDVTTSSHGQSH